METLTPTPERHNHIQTDARRWLRAKGMMADRLRSFDWSKNPLGAIETWPQSLRTIVETIMASKYLMFVLWGPHQILLYNDAYAPILGAKELTALGQSFPVLWSEIWQDLAPLVETVKRGEATRADDMRFFLTRNGFCEESYFTFSYSPLRDDQGEIAGLFCSGAETTLRVLSERRAKSIQLLTEQLLKAQDSSAILRAAAETFAKNKADIPFAFVYDMDPTSGKPRLAETTGLGNQSDSNSLMNPDALFGSDIVTEAPRVVPVTPTMYTKDTLESSTGVPKRAWLAPLINPTGKAMALIVLGISPHLEYDPAYREYFESIATQICATLRTKESQFEAARAGHELKLAAERLRLTIETIPQGIWRADPDGSVDYYSERFYSLVGYAAEEFLGWGWANPIHDDDRERVMAEWQRGRDAAGPVSAEFRVREKNGNYRWYLSQGNPYFDENGRLSKYYGTWTDIHDRKVAQEQLSQAKNAAESANALKTAFLANMSHEIRTPLGAILGFTELLKDQTISADDRRKYFEIVARNGQALTRIIDDILDLSKVEAGKLQVENSPLSLPDLIKEIEILFFEKARSKGLDLLFSISAIAPHVIISDVTRIRQILINIVGNAVKFTEEGEVRVSVDSEPLTHDRWHLTFRIADTGPGISTEQCARLFQPFMQADNSTTRQFGGTGLGLILSKRLAQALGGDVLIEKCSPGVGCTFAFTLTAHVPTATPEQPPLPSKLKDRRGGEHDLENTKILLVEDSQDNQILIRRMLTKRGATIDLASDGLEGVEKALNKPYDVILMDIQMPNLDGYQATKKLRASGYRKPIIALTAHAMIEERQRTKEAGCNAHLTKPLDSEILISTIQEWVKRKEPLNS